MFTLLFFATYPAIVLLDVLLFFVLVALAAEEQFVVWLIGIAALAGVMFYFSPTALALVMSNPLYILAGFVSYFAIGVAYSIYKWWSFVDASLLKQKYENWKASYPQTRENKFQYESEEKAKEEFLNSSHNPYRRVGFSLSDKNNWKISNWIVTWPFSLLVDLFRAFFVDLTKNLVRIFSGVYDKITKVGVDKL